MPTDVQIIESCVKAAIAAVPYIIAAAIVGVCIFVAITNKAAS